MILSPPCCQHLYSLYSDHTLLVTQLPLARMHERSHWPVTFTDTTSQEAYGSNGRLGFYATGTLDE